MSTTIFMFHAIGSITLDDWADSHYGYCEDKFHNFLVSIGKVQSLRDAIDSGNSNTAIVTFDDGHVSNYYAAKYIHDNNFGSADFFINPEKVGLPFYMNWDQIKELNSWGMSIQSHGLDHQYLTDCDDVELHRQILLSKNIIEENIDNKVSILAPPGGRFDKRTISICKNNGYTCIANSIPGKATNLKTFLFPRISVLSHHSADELLALQNQGKYKILIKIVKYKILLMAKNILGNTVYDKLRHQVLGG